jgi:hypothetical protein
VLTYSCQATEAAANSFSIWLKFLQWSANGYATLVLSSNLDEKTVADLSSKVDMSNTQLTETRTDKKVAGELSSGDSQYRNYIEDRGIQ